MRETIDFGIDLGTTNSSIALFKGMEHEVFKSNENWEYTPSAVWMDKHGALIVGQRAYERLVDDEENAFAEFKLRMGTGEEKVFARNGRRMKPEELSAEVLKSLKADVRRRTGEEIQSAVITVPAAFELPQCDATKKAAELAGLTFSPLLQEPVAAALAYGFQSDSDRVFWLVYDLGGGTFDAAVMQVRDGAASALALAHMIMALELPIALRVLVPAAENSVAGNAFRPGDVLTSRLGKTVEVGNTDAEGRLVLADALALGDETGPDLMISLATLTGAARVALGPDLPAFFTDDDDFAAAVARRGLTVGDPVWRLPLWRGYNAKLDSEVADMNNVSDGPFAGAITAALFLKRFVTKTRRYAHIDLYGWRAAARPLGPKGGEPHAARLLLATLSDEVLS